MMTFDQIDKKESHENIYVLVSTALNTRGQRVNTESRYYLLNVIQRQENTFTWHKLFLPGHRYPEHDALHRILFTPAGFIFKTFKCKYKEQHLYFHHNLKYIGAMNGRT